MKSWAVSWIVGLALVILAERIHDVNGWGFAVGFLVAVAMMYAYIYTETRNLSANVEWGVRAPWSDEVYPQPNKVTAKEAARLSGGTVVVRAKSEWVRQ